MRVFNELFCLLLFVFTSIFVNSTINKSFYEWNFVVLSIASSTTIFSLFSVENITNGSRARIDCGKCFWLFWNFACKWLEEWNKQQRKKKRRVPKTVDVLNHHRIHIVYLRNLTFLRSVGYVFSRSESKKELVRRDSDLRNDAASFQKLLQHETHRINSIFMRIN